MRCPFCGAENAQVRDSRPAEENHTIRRRRECQNCGARFTTFERVQLRELIVLKEDGRQEPFDREKLFRSLSVALRKRPVETDRIEQATNALIRRFESSGLQEIPTADIGEMVSDSLKKIDQVGYIRFISVYRDFTGVKDFKKALESLDE